MKKLSHTVPLTLFLFSMSPGLGCAPSEEAEETQTENQDTQTDTAFSLFVTIKPVFEGAESVPAFSVSAVVDQAAPVHAYCGTDTIETDPDITCEEGGAQLHISDTFNNLVVTAKAEGYAFATATFSSTEVEQDSKEHSIEIALTPLEPFEVEGAYQTGFREDELDRFKEMAYPAVTEMGAAYAEKFVITDLDTHPVVYFQNTKEYPTHHEFVRVALGMDITSTEFWDKAYHGEDREFLAGTVVLYDAVHSECDRLGHPIEKPFALTFFPSDDLTVEQARFAHRLIEERLGFSPLFGGTSRLFYLPAGENQEDDLTLNVDLFIQWDAGWVMRREIYRQIAYQIMNPGLSYGTLRLADSQALENEVYSFKDILVLPTLPIQLPIVGGTITEEFQTPLAHVNVMAKNRGTPNLTLMDASVDPEVSDLIGKLVRFEVTDEDYSIEEATQEEADAFWTTALKDPITLESDTAYDELSLFEDISFDDWIRVGAKAANLAELRQLLGEQAPYGFAIPFYYYKQAMDIGTFDTNTCENARADCVLGNRAETVCDDARLFCESSTGVSFNDYVSALLNDDRFKSDTIFREAALAGLRFLIASEQTDPLSASKLDEQTAAVFGTERVRLRSSTNTEDTPGFSGAGLYDSVSAEADGDESTSKKIREVWASVWTFRAFEERSYWNIDHLSTYMGVAVNQAFGTEAANGVLITQNIADSTVAGMYVNVQEGEVSVTNPTGMIDPEIFSIIPGTEAGTIQAAHLGFSSLSPDKPIMTDDEILTLYNTAIRVRDHFAPLYGTPAELTALDLEFKLAAGDRALVIKQARPYIY